MQLMPKTRITLAICATVLILGICAFAWLSGAKVNALEVLGAVGSAIGGLLAGFGIAGGPTSDRPTEPFPSRRPRGTPTAFLVLTATMLWACEIPGPRDPTDAQPEPWDQARTAMQYVRIAVGALTTMVPPEVLEHEQSIRCAQAESEGDCPTLPALVAEALGEVEAEIDRWEQRDGDPRRWVGWLGRALQWSQSLIDIVREHGADIPAWVGAMAEGGAAILLTLAGESPPGTCSIDADGKGGESARESWVWCWLAQWEVTET